MRNFLGGLAAGLLLIVGGYLIWQGRTQAEVSNNQEAALVGEPAPEPLTLPEGASGLRGKAPPGLPTPPEAAPKSREEKRFNRYDKDRDEAISRLELMASRAKDFKKLDVDGNNLLSFEEWAVKTSEKFAGADADGNGRLTRGEFATTAPKRKAAPACRC